MKEHYYFNPITDVMIVMDVQGKCVSGCMGNIAATVARIQTLNEPESITWDLGLTVRNAEERVGELRLGD